jgi:hypothetical protein
MCACKETDVMESPNDSTLAGGEGQGGRGLPWKSRFLRDWTAFSYKL